MRFAPFGSTPRATGMARTMPRKPTKAARAAGSPPICIERKATPGTPPTGTAAPKSPSAGTRSKRNGGPSRGRCSATPDGSGAAGAAATVPSAAPHAPGDGKGPCPMTSDSMLKTSIGLIAAVVVSAAAYLADVVFAPLALAIFIIALVWPLQHLLQARMPAPLALAITMTVTVAVMLAFASLVVWGFGRVGQSLIADSGRYQAIYDALVD